MPLNCGLNSGVGSDLTEKSYDQRQRSSNRGVFVPGYYKYAMYQTQEFYLRQVSINTKQEEDFEQYVLNFLYVSMIQNVLCFLLFLVKGRNIKML